MNNRIIMILLFIALFLGACFYVFWRIWHLMPPVAPIRITILTVGITATLCLFLYFIVAGKVPYWLGAAIYRLGTSWIMILLYLLIAFLLFDIVRATRLAPMEWMRHGNWTAFGIFALTITAIMVIGNIVYHNKKRVELNLELAGMPANADPVKIVAIGDLHLGYGIGRCEFSRWVEMINAEKPDLILLAGDAIDTHPEPLYDRNMDEVFRRFAAPVYAATGNHEYISGIDRSAAFLERAGVTLLRDSAALIGNEFYVLGRDDRTNRNRKPLRDIVVGLDRSKPVILLDHQPYDLSEAADNGIALQLSGHTHLGQVWPISLITEAIFEKAHGYARRGDTHYFVTSGLGIWGGKFRIGTRSEYVVINISGAGSE